MSALPGTYNLQIYQGATFRQIFTWLSSVCHTTTAGSQEMPVDLTGYTAAMQIRAFALSPTVEYDASNNLTLGGPLGTITLLIPSSETEDFIWWAGVYDILLTDPSGTVTAFLTGTVTVIPGITIPSAGQPILTDSGVTITTDGGVQINTSN